MDTDRLISADGSAWKRTIVSLSANLPCNGGCPPFVRTDVFICDVATVSPQRVTILYAYDRDYRCVCELLFDV